MNLAHAIFPALILVALAVSLADIRRIATRRITYRLVWAAAIAIALGCGYLIG